MTSAAPEAGEGAPDLKAGRISLGKGRALMLVPQPKAAAALAGLTRSHGYIAAGVAVAMGLSFVAGTALFADRPHAAAVAQAGPPPDTTMDVLIRVQGEVRSLKASLEGMRSTAENSRQDEAIRGLKRSVDTLRGDLDGVRTASTAAVGQLGAKLDKLDRDPGPKLAEIASRLDKLDREPGQKLAEVTARLDRVERQVSAADQTGSLPPPSAGMSAQASKAPMPPPRAVQSTPPVPAVAAVPPSRPELTARADLIKADVIKADPAKVDPVKPDPAKAEIPPRQESAARSGTVEGWMLRDVYGGVALLEGRAGLREVAPGEYVPGVGEIRSIERRGRGWVVVTSRGIIQADNRW